MKVEKQKVIINFLLIILVVICLYPIIIMLFGSFKTAEELSSNPAGFPINPTLENYFLVFTYNNGLIFGSFLNSIFVSVSNTLLTLVISAMAAYAFAKCEFKGRNVIFFALLSTMMIPTELTIPPVFIMFSKMRLLNTYSIQIFPTIANVFALYMIRQYMYSIPNAMLEAAKIDGAGHWRIFTKIVLPTITPVLSALGILVFLNRWNEYLWPSIMVSNERLQPLLVILPRLTRGTNVLSIPWELVLAGCSVASIPIFVIFFVFQKKFMASVVLGSIKE
jgi:ABC-type glycerol-3-phosphate transport system permease component